MENLLVVQQDELKDLKDYLNLASKTLDSAPEHYGYVLDLLKQYQDQLSIYEQNRHIEEMKRLEL
jgi:hypothetical protein